MACRGVHFALDANDATSVLAAPDDRALLTVIQESIEERWDEEWLAQSDKAWDAIHRCLTDGTLSVKATTPRHRCILGGQQLHQGDSYVVSFVSPEQVQEVAEAIQALDETWMRTRYFAIPQSNYPHPLCEDDFQYTWAWFQHVRALYLKAATAGRAMIFTVDQ